MNLFSMAAAIAGDNTNTHAAEQMIRKIQPVIICGACGAEEKPVDEHNTECPNCDEYIY